METLQTVVAVVAIGIILSRFANACHYVRTYNSRARYQRELMRLASARAYTRAIYGRFGEL